VSHQAPHDPYHLPKEWRSRHVGEYDKGWDAVRQERLKRQIEPGIMPAGTQLGERMWFVPDPIVLAPASRALLGKKMELYAGMVENLDFHIGRLVDHLKGIGEYENTIFIVFGDNRAGGQVDCHRPISPNSSHAWDGSPRRKELPFKTPEGTPPSATFRRARLRNLPIRTNS
jgi:arylsulfatase A-like enzyme